ncbi:hypothetical protein [Heyndrickxia sporothermodurans]|uniref:hypothetical protein n=1 Tax=Heyndrickxia sporothermodurans TaxID=46224 RepID=UPI002E1BA611|nr:hypothetical protein [Heyndrickxia sporothermodurans]MED3697939.1 hypothetical protein [Heyndrickxia sporothermodurans]
MSRSFNVSVSGLSDVLKSLDATPIVGEIDKATEYYARKMANETAIAAPRKTGALANSFPPSVEKQADCAWSYGSDLPYATRQEYEHESKKGFVRKTVWNNRDPYRNTIKKKLGEIGR